MARGGARNRSGPAPDPNSERSERRGFKLTALPAQGYTGEIPDFPLPPRRVTDVRSEGGRSWREYDPEQTEATRERELEVWAWAWRTPQACAWSMPSESWRLPIIALWVRTLVLCEGADATAADKNSLHRFADQIGFTPAGLRENGWKVAVDEVSEKRETTTAPARRERRLRVANDGGE